MTRVNHGIGPGNGERTEAVVRERIGILLAVGLLTAGFGVASAFADHGSGGNTTAGTTTGSAPLTTTTANPGDEDGQAGDDQGEQGDDAQGDEQGAASNVTAAATGVENEAARTTPDDESGDQAPTTGTTQTQTTDNGQQGDSGDD
jgi:hypothetical protein